ncbi:MAG: nucleotide sugar dehydrogenase [Anaerolineae bacterium]|nr:nucleotide sugar dehydrogenase [Anaerolineae bacterium]
MVTDIQKEAIAKIKNREATVAVIGLGYVGLPLAVIFAEAGFQVVGIDINPKRVDTLNQGISCISDVPTETIAQLVAQGKLKATTTYDGLTEADAAIICVPTPLGKTKDPDLSYVISAIDEIAYRLHAGMLVVLESTTYPGTTEELILPRLEKANGQTYMAGTDFFLAFSPERIDPGRQDWMVHNTPKVIGGVTPKCLEVAQTLYASAIEQVIPVSSPKVAEMVKLLENTFRAVNIALVNEVAIMCDRLGIEVWEVIEAAKTKPFGFMSFYPGPGLGGHCIPIDPEYLAWKLKTLNYNARFIQLAAEVNFGMPQYVTDKIVDALNEDKKAVKGSRILILGVAYKEDVGDLRESPALDLIHLLQTKGAEVIYHDPYVPHLNEDGLVLTSITLNQAALQQADCVVITAAHNTYDWPWVLKYSQLVVDTRNATRAVTGSAARVVKL